VELTRATWRDEPQRLGATITMHTALQEGLPEILGVESELREALVNLIFNAVDAMPHGGCLTLQTRATPTAVVVEVSDTGIGMDEATRQRCLEPFFTTKVARGTGLGLAMVYGVTERHAAQLSIESAVGQGTTIRLLLPLALSQSALEVEATEVEASAGPLRILVVDDDPLVRQLLQDVLHDEGHVVMVVEGGKVGLEALRGARERQEPFDVVITDLGMPEMDGHEVARGVKDEVPATPVILLTGWGQALRQEESLPSHVDVLLSKPPGLQELRVALRAVTRPATRRTDYGHN
jgi:CheY-like chemotaxis protein/anti-sigma regulatory factor (Ser/Thr protein kinase)